eukprot:TRINITY_DN2946_c0_g1_i1.p1 TRINITY_DN2946_c0_g1~~TRINITY_DN2946_c0_g1_i1.p1  ORF type:complete len:414 (+),score=127.35 TRINITY_DN2946_c0_g1_i1:27-1244(+)
MAPPNKGKDVEEQASNVARFGRMKNSLKMGIVGLPNVGKSSLFNILTEQNIAAENYPFCTIEPNNARCAVPDDRYEYLCDMWKPPSMYPAYLHITDIAGLVKGAAEGAGLGNAFLSHIQAIDGIFHVVRIFDDREDVVHVDSSVDPVRDLETIQHELCAKDLEYTKSQERLSKLDVKKTPNMKLPLKFFAVMEKVTALLEADKPVRDAEWNQVEVDTIREKLPNLITTKPIIYLLNMSKKDFARKKNKHLGSVAKWIKDHGGGVVIPFSVAWEEEYFQMKEDPAAQKAFEVETKCKSALPRMVVTGYKELNLFYFFTAGEKEVRCWTVQKGSLAPQAAGVIHTDFEKAFIKAEVVTYDDFKAIATTKGMGEVKAAGKMRQEGKKYVVQDGDIIHFQIGQIQKKKK